MKMEQTTFISETNPVPEPMTSITSAKVKRQKFTDEQKRTLVMHFNTRPANQSAQAFCKSQRVTESALRRWANDRRFAYHAHSLQPSRAKAPAPARKLSSVIAKVLPEVPEKYLPGRKNNQAHKFTEEFKAAVLDVFRRRGELGLGSQEVADHFGIQPSVMYFWDQARRAKKNDPHAMIARAKTRQPEPPKLTRVVENKDSEIATLKLRLTILQGILALAQQQGFDLDKAVMGYATKDL